MTYDRPVRIDVLICAFRRASIVETLKSIDAQETPDNISLRAIVADNDDAPSAEETVARAGAAMKTPVLYVHAPARNISIARNACLDHADADWVAFIDDDECAAPDWIARLYHHATSNGCDAVFGPALADYGETAPGWIRDYDYHTNRPLERWGEVQTGHTCNALMRWRGAPYAAERFRLDKGRSGGEDTEFFFRLWRGGAKLGLADDARVHETVDPARLNFDWIRTRKFRAGQTYGRHAGTAVFTPAWLALSAAAKIGACGAMAAVNIFSTARQRYWLLRGVFHFGVLTAQFGFREHALYGE
ncbi:MAG: glycosyltransferase family 2 protein [Oricola sp.]|nr:glycosyltransferase family 2 protein [Oricola sp.]